MEQFNKIIESLDVSCILIVENDLKVPEKEEEILSKYALLNKNNKEKLLIKLSSKGYITLEHKLRQFDEEFSKLDHTDQKSIFLSVGEINSYIDKLPNNGSAKTLSSETKDELVKNTDAKRIFFQYGITSTTETPYDPFLSLAITESETGSIILLFQDIVPAEHKEVEKDILAALDSGKKSIIAIVDKMLGDGEPNGQKIAGEYLPSISKNNDIAVYPFILTSQADSTLSPEKLNNYNQLVVSKTSDDLIKDICNAISINAYSQIFSFWENQTLESLVNASEIVAKNKNNIAYIIDKANKEGMLPYEAIYIWYENALNLYANQLIAKIDNNVFTSTIGLSKLLKREEKENGTLLSPEFTKHLDDLNTNEIFDYSINYKHLPIAPGDIFISGEKYFVVIGQTCDLSLRDDLSRSSKLLKLVSASYESSMPKKSKGEKVARHLEYIILSHFKKGDSEIGCLKIDLKTKSTSYVDYLVLDLCMYNSSGQCAIDVSKPLERPLINYFAEANTRYYSVLQKKISALESIPGDVKDSLKAQSNELLTYTKEGDVYTFPYKRICRIRGNFNHLIHHHYWHYRGRTDLNEINLTED